MQAPWDYPTFAAVAVIALGLEMAWLRRRRVPWAYFLPSVLILALILIPGQFLTEAAGNRARDSIIAYLKGIAPTYAGEIMRLGHSQVGLDSAQDPRYLNIIEAEKRWLKANPNIADVYTVRKQGEGYVFIVDSETDYDHDGIYSGDRENRTPIGEKVTSQQSATEWMALAFAGMDSFDPRIYTDRWGTWVTAYSPLRDADGRVEAVVGVDYPADLFMQGIQTSRLTSIGLLGILVLILLSCTAIFILLRVQMWEMQRTTTSLESLNREVEERKRAEQAARESEERYRLMIENVPTVVWASNADGRLVFVSPNVKQVLGFTSEEICTQDAVNWFKRCHAEDAALVQEKQGALFRKSEPFELVYRVQHKDGHFIWISLRAAAPEQRGGERLAYGVFSDITAQHELERRLQQAQKMENVGCLAAGIAHDFNNLLTSIIGFSELTRMSADAGSDVARCMGQIIEVAMRGRNLTQQLLAFARKRIIHPEIVDLNTLLAAMEPMLRRLIGENIELVFTPQPGLRLVSIDTGSLEQIVMNMAVNAMHAMPTGGKLTITTRNVDVDEALAATLLDMAPGPCVMLEITDTGGGMSDAVRSRIFEPFFTTKPVGQGTGLGLAMSHGIVQQAKGHITVASQPGQGSTFKILLPEARSAPQPDSPLRAPVAPRGTETILLVDDDPMIRLSTQRILEHMGYTVLVAGDGMEALKVLAAARTRVDVLFTDLVMPQMGGQKLAEIIEAQYPGIRILFASGYSTDDIAQKGVLSGQIHFIEKPYTPDVLVSKIRALCAAPTITRGEQG